jgi:hypothetical protein
MAVLICESCEVEGLQVVQGLKTYVQEAIELPVLVFDSEFHIFNRFKESQSVQL